MSCRDYLEAIVASTRQRVACEKQELPLGRIARLAEERAACEAAEAAGGAAPPTFAQALAAPGLSFICEIKRASPSKGSIANSIDPAAIAKDYQAAGASAVSVLTEPRYFQGENRFVTEVSQAVSLPVLRKDFILEEYQVLQGKVLGAAAILLIAAILSDNQLAALLKLCHSLGMSALVETHDAVELERALCAGAGIVGVNNRNLKTFEVDLGLSERLRPTVPPSVLFVAESGIASAEDVRRMAEAKADAVLMGEVLMRAQDRRARLAELKQAADAAMAQEGGQPCA
jgi:indole-3-glycerol phosphate synthase